MPNVGYTWVDIHGLVGCKPLGSNSLYLTCIDSYSYDGISSRTVCWYYESLSFAIQSVDHRLWSADLVYPIVINWESWMPSLDPARRTCFVEMTIENRVCTDSQYSYSTHDSPSRTCCSGIRLYRNFLQVSISIHALQIRNVTSLLDHWNIMVQKKLVNDRIHPFVPLRSRDIRGPVQVWTPFHLTAYVRDYFFSCRFYVWNSFPSSIFCVMVSLL